VRLLRQAALLGLVLAALAPARALAASRPDLPVQVTSAHFAVRASARSLYVDAVAPAAEKALAVETALGFPAPLDDGDGRIDIYVTGIANPDASGLAIPESYASQTTGFIELDPSRYVPDQTASIVAHELFHLIQYSIYRFMSPMTAEATANWMARRVAPGGFAAPLWAPLDCTPCEMHSAAHNPYGRESFYAFLADRYGPSIIRELLSDQATLGPATSYASPLRVVDDVLARRGTSTSALYPSYAYSVAAAGEPDTRLTLAAPGSAVATTDIDRLAARRFLIDQAGGPCDPSAQTLTVTVTAPGGTPAAALVVTGVATELQRSGDTLTLSMRWSPCLPGTAPLLVVANPSSTDGIAQADVRVQLGAGPAPAATAQPAVPAAQKSASLQVGAPSRAAGTSVPVAVATSGAGALTVLGGARVQTFVLDGRPREIVVRLKPGNAAARLTFVFVDERGMTARAVRAIRRA
jgi:hypothetical protein